MTKIWSASTRKPTLDIRVASLNEGRYDGFGVIQETEKQNAWNST